MSLATAFAPAEAAFREKVMEHTWGHLAPKKNKTYRGHITWVLGCGYEYSDLNPTVLECELDGMSDSPWFYDAIRRFLQEVVDRKHAPGIFKWEGTFRNYKFTGKVTRLETIAAEILVNLDK